MGLFDLLTPALMLVDQFLENFLPITALLIFWGLVSALLGVLVFKLTCRFDRLTTIKQQLADAQQTMIDHEGEFSELLPLAWKTIKLSLTRLRITVFPALLSVFAVLFVLVFLSNRYDAMEPEAGAEITYSISATEDPWYWENPSTGDRSQTLVWPTEGQTLILTNGTEQVLSAPFKPVSIIHQKQWWNSLIANPSGYLPDDSAIDEVTFEFDAVDTPAWMDDYLGGWFWFYMLVTLIFSIILMVVFKVRF